MRPLRRSQPRCLRSRRSRASDGCGRAALTVGDPKGAHFARHHQSPPPRALDSLTPREMDVFRLIASGLSNAEIGRDLFISDTTVKTQSPGSCRSSACATWHRPSCWRISPNCSTPDRTGEHEDLFRWATANQRNQYLKGLYTVLGQYLPTRVVLFQGKPHHGEAAQCARGTIGMGHRLT
jgi:Bacterial regulatory proteins, luxR family